MDRRSGVASPLLDKASAGELGPDDLRRVREQLDQLHSQLSDELWVDGEEEIESYRDQVLNSLHDAFTLLNYGLDELERYLDSQDPGLLRLGRLLMEKGEQEYLSLQRDLRRVERAANPGERTVNLWGQLLEMSRDPEQAEELGEALAWAESAMEAQLEGTLRDFSRALACLPGDPEEAQRRLAISLIRFREFLGASI
ncbi:hypothetical protein JST97_38095 [bacterium]|nr:hypothetical protein [bacterium]